MNLERTKKIVAIGGGLNGRVTEDGIKEHYQTGVMDREIIKLTGKEKPNFLFIAHSQGKLEVQESYFKTMYNVYNLKYGCECKILKSNELINKEKVKELIEWSDIIYEGGGDTLSMIKLWKETGFDKVLKSAWEDGKVMCGVSAGANCWFDECSSDSLKILYGDDQPLIAVKCLGLHEGFFVPHCNEKGRTESAKELLKNKSSVGLLLSNGAALEIIDDKYRIIISDSDSLELKPYALKTNWNDNNYISQEIEITEEFRKLEELYKMEK